MSYNAKAALRDKLLTTMREHVSSSIHEQLGTLPRSDIFSFSAFKSVAESLDSDLASFSLSQHPILEKVYEGLCDQISSNLTMIFDTNCKLRFGVFPPCLTIDALNTLHADLMMAIVDIFESINGSNDTVANIRSALIVDDIKIHEKDSKVMEAHLTDLNRVTYLVLGLYFIVTIGVPEFERLRAEYREKKILNWKQPSIERRKVLIEGLRSVRNGDFCLLNYEIVQTIENSIEAFRKKSLLKLNDHVSEYNTVVDMIKEMSPGELYSIVEPTKEGNEISVPSLFVSRFISDLKYQDQFDPKKLPLELPDKAGLRCANKDSRCIDFITYADISELIKTAVEDEKTLARKLLQSKLEYLLEKVQEFKFIDLHTDNLRHSPQPIICVSGFLSETDCQESEWLQVPQSHQFSEVISLNWKSYNMTKTAIAGMSAISELSVKTIAKSFMGSICKILPFCNTDAKDDEYSNSRPGLGGIGANPFKLGLTEKFEEATGVDVEEFTGVNRICGIGKLMTQEKYHRVFNRDVFTKVSLGDIGCAGISQEP